MAGPGTGTEAADSERPGPQALTTGAPGPGSDRIISEVNIRRSGTGERSQLQDPMTRHSPACTAALAGPAQRLRRPGRVGRRRSGPGSGGSGHFSESPPLPVVARDDAELLPPPRSLRRARVPGGRVGSARPAPGGPEELGAAVKGQIDQVDGIAKMLGMKRKS